MHQRGTGRGELSTGCRTHAQASVVLWPMTSGEIVPAVVKVAIAGVKKPSDDMADQARTASRLTRKPSKGRSRRTWAERQDLDPPNPGRDS